jgi:hypothetical protein
MLCSYPAGVNLTEDKLHAVALEARSGLRDCLNMIELHARDSANAFLNPGIVVTAVSTWERFIVDVCLASEDSSWNVENTGWDRTYDPTVPWPGSRADREAHGPAHHVDKVLVSNGVLASPLTASWRIYVATAYWGADPTEWQWADYSAEPPEQNRDLIRQAILGARSARDAAAHRLYYKKALEAQGYRPKKDTQSKRHRPPDLAADVADQQDWCYVWQSDNTYKTARQKPTIQHGYARGVVALIIQLADITIERIREHRGWVARDSQLPAEWFCKTMPVGQPCAGMKLWYGEELFR